MSANISSFRKAQAKEELDRAIRSISSEFQLQLQIPDPTLSPSKRQLQRRNEEQERCHAIYYRAHFLKFKDPSRLSICFTRFREQADDHLINRIRKPHGDHDMTPIKSSFSDPHRHRPRLTSEERGELQSYLLQLLKDNNVASQQRSKTAKRRSDEFEFSDPSSKRSRNSFDGAPACDNVDDIPVRSRVADLGGRVPAGRAARRPGPALSNGVSSSSTSLSSTQPQSLLYGSGSFNSSKASLAPTVFSATTNGAPSTQTTVLTDSSFRGSRASFRSTQPNYSDYQKDCPTEFSQRIKQFQFMPQSTANGRDVDPAKTSSFRHYEPQASPEPDDAPIDEPRLPPLGMPQPTRTQHFGTKPRDIIRSNSPTTVYSSLPEMSALDTPPLDASDFDTTTPSCAITKRLRNIWPKFPIPGLNQAPLIILWELTRAALHCRVDLSEWDLEYKPDQSWHDQTNFRNLIFRHRLFIGAGLPPPCDRAVWNAALGSFASNDKTVVLSAEFIANTEDTVPLYRLKLQPPRLELGHRLARRFGADRFMEVIMPSPTTRDASDAIRKDEQGVDKVIGWLNDNLHYFLGRSWSPFYNRAVRKSVKDPRPPHKPITIAQERVYFFATDGNNFRLPESQFPPLEEATSLGYRTKMRRSDLLKWAINVEENALQPVPKLFSRLALSLSKTCPTVILEPHQLRHRDTMLGSHKCMNSTDKKEQKDMGDGIARMSRCFARKAASHLGLLEAPCAFQARIGSAKGMWIVDVEDDGLDDDIWIETYPSQRKWNCDFEDIHHRTFEVREWSRELKSASLNTQFIPVLEAQSPNPGDMRNVIANHLANGLQEELNGQLAAMTHPTSLRGWMHRGFDRSTLGHVPFTGGLPDRDEDIVSFMLDAGFDATKCRFLRDLVWNNQKRQADQLKAKMNIKIPRSTYAFMVVDFTGTLEEGEVQLAFSSKFQADGESDTLLDDIDILVARAPAHFVSDVQKVRAVFRPNLKRLKDVIVFSSKGKSPLADMLSGGDYDGDKAWICWDPNIVRNFSNAPKPIEPDLIGQGYLRKFDPSFQSILNTTPDMESACTDFLRTAITFNVQPSYLGIATKFKERLCYLEGRVDSERAVALSTLVALLVDQSKQGLLFTRDDYNRLKRDMEMSGKEPAYENERSSEQNYKDKNGYIHILDFLKFVVAEDTVVKALKQFYDALQVASVQAWDKDLARLFNEYNDQKRDSRTIERLMADIVAKVEAITAEWKVAMSQGKTDSTNSEYSAKVKELHQKWSSYKPSDHLMNMRIVEPLFDSWNGDPALSKWELLKASALFKLKYEQAYGMVWRLSGKQLAWMKAMVSRGTSDASAIAVTAEMWSILRPDSKRIAALHAQRQMGHDNESLAALEEVIEYDESGTQIDDA
ncbi:hypothetical protein FLONG3_10335 [Fusarium longipes]|uniref:RNA-dependent RNA polymerase n=1 Tax=Fusarium longipes TaxID=694270 RepID=A0A395RPN9_9HYPO|nr:hypothetical protein FLONG3_10335 [Fusarium longipes]